MGKDKEFHGEDQGKAGVLIGEIRGGGQQSGDFPRGEITVGSPIDRRLGPGKRPGTGHSGRRTIY